MEAAGHFLRLLSKPKIACKPKGDQDPIPEEWNMKDPEDKLHPEETEMEPEVMVSDEEHVDQEEAEEEAWRASTAAMQIDKGEMQQVPQGHYEEEAEEEKHEEDELADGDEDEQPEVDADEELARSRREYDEMDKEMGHLKKFVEAEHGKDGCDKKRKHDDDDDGQGHADASGWQSNKHRNKGTGGQYYGHGYYNHKWHYNGKYQGKGWQNGKSWGKGKGKGKWQGQWKPKWDWEPEQKGMVLQASKNGGWYLPNGQGYLDPSGTFHPPGQGLGGKSRVRGGAKAQQQKMKAKKEAEALENKQHERQMMSRLAGIAEKALDKIG